MSAPQVSALPRYGCGAVRGRPVLGSGGWVSVDHVLVAAESAHHLGHGSVHRASSLWPRVSPVCDGGRRVGVRGDGRAFGDDPGRRRLPWSTGGGHEGTSSPFVDPAGMSGATGSSPAALDSRSRKAPSSAIVLISGAGKTTVEFLSTATSTSVWRLRNCSASGWAIITSEAVASSPAARASP